MKIIITHDSAALKQAGFELDETYEVSQAIGETLIGSKWAEEVKDLGMPNMAWVNATDLEVKDLGSSPENKMLSVPENK